MKKKIEITVIIPMYNAENTITTCINSVFNQTYKGEIEIIVVNDGSKDSSQEIVEDIIRNNKSLINIQLVNKNNGGVSSARNKGLKLAKGEYIAFLDSDDEWVCEKVEKQLDVFNQNPAISFVGGLTEEINSSDEDEIVEIPLSRMIFKHYFQPSTVMFRREIISEIGFFDETLRYSEEGNYFMRIASVYKCVLLKKQLVLYGSGKRRFGVSGLSANLKEMEKGELKNLLFAYKNNYISLFVYLIAFVYSVLKYFRRILIVKFNF